ncbi:MAG: hypothetical protein EOO65_01660 [Methanosarcinales archaeon]|nr:MAG: hypothetical protein EOO65_01660 [Methanosarcinales archaeon]
MQEIAAQVAAATARAGALGGGAARGACSSTLAGAMLSSLDSASASADGATSTSGAPPRKRAHKEMQAAGASITGAQSKRVPANLCRFIVNVSAMEGKFHRHKLPTHPHTNMAKAALNMMTRTSAQDYAQDFIYMNACDTGWSTFHAAVRALVHHACHVLVLDVSSPLTCCSQRRKSFGACRPNGNAQQFPDAH